MSFDVRIPILRESVENARAVIAGVQDGSMERYQANHVLGGTRLLQTAVKIELAVRLAEPKLEAAAARAASTRRKAAVD